jgi:hypothetical protein
VGYRRPMWWALLACQPTVGVGVPWLDLPGGIEVVAVLDAPTVAAVEVHNTGTATARVSATVEPGPFSVPSGLLTIEPGAAETLFVTYSPGSADQAGSATLRFDTGFDRFSAELRGIVDVDADDDGAATTLAGGDDCDDHDPARFPANPEVCNGVDDDCTGSVDDVDDPPVWHRDRDGDGFGDPAATVAVCFAPDGAVADGTDCDDRAEATFPGAPDPFYDGVDADCAGDDDHDQDLDGARAPSGGGGDCDDLDPAVGPAVAEVWYDGVDQDCDGNDDDQDLDGSGVAFDCDDLDATVAPDAPELDDGADQDCDGLRDEGLWGPGTLLVTELLENPVRVGNTRGHYLELVNPTDGDVDLGEVRITLGIDSTVLQPRWLAPGEVVVACSDLNPARNGGVPCTDLVSWTTSVPDAVTVEVAATGFVVDTVPLTSFPVPAGASRELRADVFDAVQNDLSGSWCTATTPFGLGDLGTPGDPVPSCP